MWQTLNWLCRSLIEDANITIKFFGVWILISKIDKAYRYIQYPEWPFLAFYEHWITGISFHFILSGMDGRNEHIKLNKNIQYRKKLKGKHMTGPGIEPRTPASLVRWSTTEQSRLIFAVHLDWFSTTVLGLEHS